MLYLFRIISFVAIFLMLNLPLNAAYSEELVDRLYACYGDDVDVEFSQSSIDADVEKPVIFRFPIDVPVVLRPGGRDVNPEGKYFQMLGCLKEPILVGSVRFSLSDIYGDDRILPLFLDEDGTVLSWMNQNTPIEIRYRPDNKIFWSREETVKLILAEGKKMPDQSYYRIQPGNPEEKDKKEGLWLLPQSYVDADGKPIILHCISLFGCEFSYMFKQKHNLRYRVHNQDTRQGEHPRGWQTEPIDWVAVDSFYRGLIEKLIVTDEY
jgi:hypothetical protein